MVKAQIDKTAQLTNTTTTRLGVDMEEKGIVRMKTESARDLSRSQWTEDPNARATGKFGASELKIERDSIERIEKL